MSVAKLQTIGRHDLWVVCRDRRSLPVVALGQIGADWVPVVLDGTKAREIGEPEMVAMIVSHWMPTRAQIDGILLGRHISEVEIEAAVPDGSVIWEASLPSEKEKE